MKLIIDLDGTICSEEKQFSRALAQVNVGAKEPLQKLKGLGHTVIIYSARTWAEYEVTVAWLEANEIPYDQLILGKPQGDFWIDDRALRYHDWETIMSTLIP